jgi:hypothetical protein
MELFNLLGAIEKGIRNNSLSEPLEMMAGKSISEFDTIEKLLNEHITKMN